MKKQRQKQILEIIGREKFATVDSLSKKLFVSLPTIRRDLGELQKQGLITRSHGGACVRSLDDTPFDFRSGRVPSVKLSMAKAAATLIDDGDTVFIDGSTSCLHIADNIQVGVTVVTNGVKTALALSRNDNITVYCTGGELIKNSLSYAGVRAEQFVDDFYFDKMFFSSSALDGDGNVTDYSFAETSLRRKVMQKSRQKIFLCDKSKHGKAQGCFVATLSDIDTVISDAVISGVTCIVTGDKK